MDNSIDPLVAEAQDPSGYPFEARKMLLDIRRKALEEMLQQQSEGSVMPNMPRGQMVSGRYVAPHWTQQLAAALEPVLKSAKLREYEERFKAENADFYKANKAATDKWMNDMAGRVPSQTDQAGFGPTPEQGSTVPLGTQARLQLLSKGMGIPGVSDLSRRMVLEDLVRGPATKADQEFRDKELNTRIADAAQGRKDRLADAALSRSEQDARARDLANQRSGDMRYVSDQNNETRRMAIGNALQAAEDKAAEKRAVETATAAKERQGTELGVRQAEERKALLDAAKGPLGSATGSGAGRAVDATAGFFGYGTEGAMAGAKLKALTAQLLTLTPKLGGSTSDADVKNYREAVGQLGDETLPRSVRKAAWDTVQEVNDRARDTARSTEANRGPSRNTGGASDSWGPKPVWWNKVMSDIKASRDPSGTKYRLPDGRIIQKD